MLQAATGALLSTDPQGALEWQPAVPTRATREADAWNMHAAAAAVHGAWLAPTAHCIQRVDAALRARWTPRPRGAGQLPQPGCLQPATNFQNALFTNIEVGHWLILSKGAQSIDRVSGGCEHLLAEGVRHWASVSAACVAITGRLFCMGWPTLPGYLPFPEDPRTVSGFTSSRPVARSSCRGVVRWFVSRRSSCA